MQYESEMAIRCSADTGMESPTNAVYAMSEWEPELDTPRFTFEDTMLLSQVKWSTAGSGSSQHFCARGIVVRTN